MSKVMLPHEMNAAFARAFNSRTIGNLLALYESEAALRTDGGDRTLRGLREIETALAALLQVPGTMTSINNFCIAHGDLALLRADWRVMDGAQPIASGSSAEIVRRQADGAWLYVVDHAMGAGLPRVG